MNITAPDPEHDPQLDSLLGEMRRTHRVRKGRAVVAITCVLLLAIALPMLMTQSTPAQPTTPTMPGIAKDTHAPDKPLPVPDDTTPSSETPRTSIITVSNKRSPTIVRTIGDDELLQALQDTGRRAGLIRTGGAVILDADWLTKADDTDTQRGESDLPATPPPPKA